MFQHGRRATQAHLAQDCALGLFLWSSIAALTAPANCQAPPPHPDSADRDRISFDLVAHDKKGRPVLDLKPADVAIVDGDSPVVLDDLRLVTGDSEGERLIALVFDRPSPAAGARAGADSSWLKSEREAAEKLLKTIPEKGHFISVLTVEGRLRLVQPFTADRSAVLQAVKTATDPAAPAGGVALSQPEQALGLAMRTGADASGKPLDLRDRALAKALFPAFAASARIAQDQHMRPWLAGLLALMQSQQQIAHRKAVVFFASPHDRQTDSSAKNAIQSIVGTANRGAVSIYVVDLNWSGRNLANVWEGAQVVSSALQQTANAAGVSAGAPVDSSNAGAEMQSSARRMQAEGLDPSRKQESSEMRHLAEDTGGSFGTESDIQKMAKQMLQDLATYYEASYPSPQNEYDGKFRPLTVKPLRPGLKLRSRSGYIAEPPSSANGAHPQPFELPLVKILAQPQLPAEIDFRSAILHIADTPDGSVNVLAIEVPLESLEVRSDSSTNLSAAHVSIVADIEDNAGALIEHFSADIPHREALGNAEKAKNEAIGLQRNFVVPPGHYVLQIAILDRNSSKAAARRIPFVVAGASAMPALSDVVLVRASQPVRADDDPADPLRYGDGKITPNLSGQLPSGAKEVSVFFVVHSDPQAPLTPALRLEVLRDGKLMATAPVVSSSAAKSEFASYLTSFVVAPPRDGRYEARVVLGQEAANSQAAASFTLTGVGPARSDSVVGEFASTEPMEFPAPAAEPGGIAFTAHVMQRPAQPEIDAMLADATRLAMSYRDSLPNFTCEQVTSRSVNRREDRHGASRWQHRDTFAERLTYLDRAESRTLLGHRQGDRTSTDAADVLKGALSFGEFGNVITNLFQPASKTEFQWKQAGMLGDEPVQVFDYRVTRQNSTFHLRTSAQQVTTVGFHGQVFLDSATLNVRRVTEVVDNVPVCFPLRAASVSVDFDYVAINNHDYMLPIGAQVLLRKGNGETDLNEIEFRNFHRFGSNMKILDGAPEVKR